MFTCKHASRRLAAELKCVSISAYGHALHLLQLQGEGRLLATGKRQHSVKCSDKTRYRHAAGSRCKRTLNVVGQLLEYAEARQASSTPALRLLTVCKKLSISVLKPALVLGPSSPAAAICGTPLAVLSWRQRALEYVQGVFML